MKKIKIFTIITFIFLLTIPINDLHPFAFVFAGESNGLDIVTHPIGYTGTGGTLTVTVGIDPTSTNAADMVISTKNVISIINDLTATTGNVLSGASNDVGATEIDFESTLLHELIHSLGLAHCNLGSQTGVGSGDRNYSYSSNGADNVFDVDDGADNIIGSADDIRGDDDNLNWFRISNNNPFTLASTIDNTTYSRDLADLPSGDTYSANGDRDVGAALGFANTEAVMQQGVFTDETQRTLGHDDIAGLTFAMAGLDEVAGTADDYTLVLSYAGLTSSADMTIDFDDSKTGLAVSQNGGIFLSANHLGISSTTVYFNSTINWYFNTVELPVELLAFEVEKSYNDAIISWSTAMELDHDYFELQRSNGNAEWENINKTYSVDPNEFGERFYTYLDDDFGQYGEAVYYRLKIVALDGTIEYSTVQALKSEKSYDDKIALSNNPINENTTINFDLDINTAATISLISIDGRILSTKNMNLNQGQNELLINDLFEVGNGISFIRVEFGTFRKTFKVVKL